MDSVSHVKRAASAPSGQRPYFLENADCDRLLTMILAMGAQISTLNERLDSLTRILEQKNLMTVSELEQFQPTEQIQAERLAWDDAFVTRLLRVLSYEFESLKATQGQESSI